MTSPITKTNINLGVKVCDCFFSMAGVLLVLYFLNGPMLPILAMVLAIVIIVAAIVLLIVWHYHAYNLKFPSAKVHAWLTGIIRYTIAYTVSTYGFAKVLKTQFGIVYSRNDMPVGSLSGFELTWNYFGYSYKLALILAALQIGGAILLLFRRTTLLGICILLPVMMNIVLINVFYSIAVGAFLVSIILTGGLVYLLLLNRRLLIQLFFNTVTSLPPLQLSYFKHVIRFFVIIAAFYTVYRYIKDEKPIDFTGKWKVDKLERHGKLVDENAWMTDSTAWKNVYIEQHGILFFSPNPYVFELKRAERVLFKYDHVTRKLKLIYYKAYKPVDSMVVNITKKSGQAMEWVGKSKKGNFKLVLRKDDTPLK
jgi:hypothetical protein